ncbi:MAG: hypothetical protein IJ470_03480 [Clostridia bacterium]|nr:hypothetical protein [Clostridia bacterium]
MGVLTDTMEYFAERNKIERAVISSKQNDVPNFAFAVAGALQDYLCWIAKD